MKREAVILENRRMARFYDNLADVCEKLEKNKLYYWDYQNVSRCPRIITVKTYNKCSLRFFIVASMIDEADTYYSQNTHWLSVNDFTEIKSPKDLLLYNYLPFKSKVFTDYLQKGKL